MKLGIFGTALCAGSAIFFHSLSTSLAQSVTCENVGDKMDEMLVVLDQDMDEMNAAANRAKAAENDADPTKRDRAEAAYEQSNLHWKNAAQEIHALQLVARACMLEQTEEMKRHPLKLN